MQYGIDYNSFIYIWFDRHSRMFYIGKHFGPVDDGYVCSSKWMMQEYKKRPHDFKRRILSYVKDSTGNELRDAELLWLSKVDESELGVRYYNLKTKGFGNTRGHTKSYMWNKGLTRAQIDEYRQMRKDKLFCLLTEKPRSGIKFAPVFTKICPVCHTNFHTKKEKQTFCSNSCSAKTSIAKRDNPGFKKGQAAHNKGIPNLTAAENGKKGAAKLADKCKGRKREYKEDGTWTWKYQ
jgi:hypothetical protein